MKKSIKAYLHMQMTYPAEFDADKPFEMEWTPTLYSFKGDPSETMVFIREMQVDVVIPDDFDPVPTQVKALEKLKLAALEKYQNDVAEINERLSRLLALTNEVQS